MRHVLRCLAWGLLLAATGCGSRAAPLTPVSGRVYFRGQPLAGGTIVFTPDPERGNKGPQAWAEIDAEGHYQLATNGQPGAVSGWHRITVAQFAARPDSPSLPRRYRDPDLGEQLFEVKPEQPNQHDLHLD
jgi:hypothetical protein